MSGLRGSNICRTAGAWWEAVPFRNLCSFDHCHIPDVLHLSSNLLNGNTET